MTLVEGLWDAHHLLVGQSPPRARLGALLQRSPGLQRVEYGYIFLLDVDDVKAMHEGRWFALMLVVPAVIVGAGIYLALPFFTDFDTDYELISLVIGVGAISALPFAQKWISVSAPRRDPGYRVRAQAWGIGIAGLVAIGLGLLLVGVGVYAAYHCHTSGCSAPWWAFAALDGCIGVIVAGIGGYMLRFARRWYRDGRPSRSV